KSFCFGDGGLGVAFGNDDQALIVTTHGLILFDPLSGSTQALGDLQCDQVVNGVAAPACTLTRTLPVPPGTFPAQIVGASVAGAQDGFTIYGQAQITQAGSGLLRFRYDVRDKNLVPLPSGSATGPGPATVSVNRDGSRFMAGSALFDRNGNVVAKLNTPANLTNLGSHVIDSFGNTSYPFGIVYGHFPGGSVSSATTSPTPITPPGTPVSNPTLPAPLLTLFDADNLTVRQRLQLAENLTGRSVLDSKRSVMYAAS